MSIRTDRVAGEVQQSLASIFQTTFSDISDGLLTITKVKMAPDLKSGRVYLSQLGGSLPHDTLLKRIKEVVPQIRHELARRVRMKFVPELFFYYDDTQEEVAKVDDIFRRINLERRSTDASEDVNSESGHDSSEDQESNS
jgi:ribosome-binding factor A